MWNRSHPAHTTTRFLVDEGSDLFYDPTPLFECQKKVEEINGTEPIRESLRHHHHQQQQHQHEFFVSDPLSHRGHIPQANFGYGAVQSPTTTRHTHMGGPYNGASFGTITPSQFYHDVGTPMRIGDGHGMNLSPEMRRRVTRGMMDDGYPPMHMN
jgi:hypothetical protein